jgi:hypothetical protein
MNRSRPIRVSPDFVTKRASGSYRAMTASRSPAFRCCSKTRGQVVTEGFDLEEGTKGGQMGQNNS